MHYCNTWKTFKILQLYLTNQQFTHFNRNAQSEIPMRNVLNSEIFLSSHQIFGKYRNGLFHLEESSIRKKVSISGLELH